MTTKSLYPAFLGQIAKITSLGVALEKEYSQIFGLGNESTASLLYHYCHCGGEFEIKLIFVNEQPVNRFNLTWHCLKEIGQGTTGDYHWLTLDQIIICNERERETD